MGYGIIIFSGGVAQGLEQAAHNRLVAGSNPAAPTKIQEYTKIAPGLGLFPTVPILVSLFLLAKSQETVAGIFANLAILWQITGYTLTTFSVLSEEINGLGLAATQSHFRFVQVVGDAFAVSVLIGHEFPPLITL